MNSEPTFMIFYRIEFVKSCDWRNQH